MKLPLRYFLIACLLLGAVGVPWGWKVYQARRAAKIEKAEVETLEKELADLWKNEPEVDFPITRIVHPDGSVETRGTGGSFSRPVGEMWHAEWKARVTSIEARLEKLTGEKPERPEEMVEQILEPAIEESFGSPADEISPEAVDPFKQR